jgi:hypothetical protein
MMKPALFAVCLIGVTLLGCAEAQAQVIGVGVPVYGAPVYPAGVDPTAVYSVPAYSTSVPAYYPAPAPVYAVPGPYGVAAPVVIGAPVRVYGHWGRHHVHLHYRW